MSDKHIAFNEYFTGLCVGDTAVRNNDGEVMCDKHIAEAFNEHFTGLCVGDTALRKQLQAGSVHTEGVFQFSTIIYS